MKLPRRLVVACVLAWVLAARLIGPAAADELDDRTREVAKQLQCPVCQNLSVADSPSELAQQMRGIIRAKLAAGESAEAILGYFVDRYGPSVLVSPPKEGIALGVWIGPLVGLALGALLALGAFLSRRAPRRRPVAVAPGPAEYEALLDEELARSGDAAR
ncbi:MAG TPA: cytochrome c-type biogenesis protein CcmH [Chloroflexota bacterium]